MGINLSLTLGGQTYFGIVNPVSGPYLPTVTFSPLVAAAPRRVVSGYNGPLFRLQRSSDSAQSDFSCASGSDFPDYSAINTWKGSSSLTVVKAYDQSGNGRDFTAVVVGNGVGFDTSQQIAGCVPFQFTGVGTGYFTNTAGSAIYDRQNSSYFEVCQHNSVGTNSVSGIFEFNNGTNVIHGMYATTAGQYSYNDSDSAVNFSPNIPPRCNISAFGLTASSTEQRLFMCEQQSTHSASATPGSGAVCKIGDTVAGTEHIANRATFGWVIYPALSTSDSNSVLSNLRTMFSVPTSFDWRLVLEGDSITYGAEATNNKALWQQMSLSGTPEIFNIAQGGSLLVDHYTGRSFEVEPLYTSSVPSVLVIAAGVNDIITSSSDAASGDSLYSTAIAYVAAERKIGYRVALANILPVKNGVGTPAWNSATMDPIRTRYNALVLGNGAAADQVIDQANTSTTMGVSTAPNDTTLYADGIHPTTLGYSYLAPIWAAKLNAAKAETAPFGAALTNPTASSTGSTTATIGITTNEGNGTLYYVITTSSTAPTAAQIKAGQDENGTAAAKSGSQAVPAVGVQSVSITGLTGSTTYYAYMLQTNISSEDSNIGITNSFSESAPGTTFDTIWNTNYTYSNGNNTATRQVASTGNQEVRATVSKSGSYTGQFSITVPAGTFRVGVGLQSPSNPNTNTPGWYNNDIGYFGNGIIVYNGGAGSVPSMPSYTTGDVITCRKVGNLVGFAKNGTWINGFDPSTGANGIDVSSFLPSYVPVAVDSYDGSTDAFTADFSQWT